MPRTTDEPEKGMKAEVGREDGPDYPERMERGKRIPEKGHDGPVQVPQKQWEANNRRKDSARALLDDDNPPIV